MGAQDRVFMGFVVEGSSLSRRFLQGRHGTGESDEGHDFDCFQCVQVRRRDCGLETQGSQGCSRGCDGRGIGRIEKARFVQACLHARVEVEEEACNARAQRREPIHQGTLRLQSKARVQDGPRSRNEEVESCSELTWDSCWLNRRQIDLNLGGWSHQFEAWCTMYISQRHCQSVKK